MLLDRIDEKTIDSFCLKQKENTEFPAEKYDVYYEYDTAGGAMIYLATRKDLWDSSMPLGYYFSIGADLQVSYGQRFPWLPLLLYLRNYEKTLSEEQQKEMYGEAYYTLGAVVGLSTKELAERQTARNSFLSFLNGLEEKGLLNTYVPLEKKLVVRLELQQNLNKSLAIRMKVGESDGKLYYIQNAQNFCEALKKGSELSITSRFSVHLSLEAFEEAWQPFMQHFLEFAMPSYSGVFLVSRDKLPAFFGMIPEAERGEALFSNEGRWVIRVEETPASVSLDAAGSMTLVPSLKSEKNSLDYVISESQMIVFNLESREAVLYHFDSLVDAEIFRYFTGRSQKEIGYVSDLLIKNIAPVSAGIIRKTEKNVFKITVHISLEGEALQFETEYWTGDEKKAPSFFEGKPFEQALISSCISTLISLHGVPNGKVANADDVLYFLRSDLGPLRQVATVYLDERLKKLKVCSAPHVEIRATRIKGWLNLSIHSSEFSTEELEEIYAAYRKKKNFFLLKDNLILLEPEKICLTTKTE